jgi:hypothetical protein
VPRGGRFRSIRMIEVDAVIVGGGLSGAAVAAQLTRRTGPPVRGSRFEATAVPELCVMAEVVARDIGRASSEALFQPSLGTYS